MNQLKCLDFRTAEPDDIHTLGLLHLKTFNNSLGASIGLRYSKAFFRWFIFNKATITLVCCNSKQIIGYVIGAPEGYSKHLIKSTLLKIIFGIITHPKSLFHPNFFYLLKSRITTLFDIKSDILNSDEFTNSNNTKNTTFVLVGIGVDPKFRGQQIGFQILKEYENLVWQLNYTKIRLTVYKSNEAAISLYNKSNWSLFSEIGHKITYLKTYKDNNGV